MWTLIPTPGEKYWEYKEVFPYIFFSRLLCFSFNKVVFKRFPSDKCSFEACFWKKNVAKKNVLKTQKIIK